MLSLERRETDNAVEFLMEEPGMSSKDFDIRVEQQFVPIRGAKQFADDRTEGHFHLTEREYGGFERVIPLPCEVDEGGALQPLLNNRNSSPGAEGNF